MTDSFGLSALDADKRREKLEKASRVTFKVGMWIVLILAGVVIGVNSKAPAKPMFISSAAVVRTCQIDHRENCLVCSFTDSEGRERHKNTHCPALAPSGLMAFPLVRN